MVEAGTSDSVCGNDLIQEVGKMRIDKGGRMHNYSLRLVFFSERFGPRKGVCSCSREYSPYYVVACSAWLGWDRRSVPKDKLGRKLWLKAVQEKGQDCR